MCNYCRDHRRPTLLRFFARWAENLAWVAGVIMGVLLGLAATVYGIHYVNNMENPLYAIGILLGLVVVIVTGIMAYERVYGDD